MPGSPDLSQLVPDCILISETCGAPASALRATPRRHLAAPPTLPVGSPPLGTWPSCSTETQSTAPGDLPPLHWPGPQSLEAAPLRPPPAPHLQPLIPRPHRGGLNRGALPRGSSSNINRPLPPLDHRQRQRHSHGRVASLAVYRPCRASRRYRPSPPLTGRPPLPAAPATQPSLEAPSPRPAPP